MTRYQVWLLTDTQHVVEADEVTPSEFYVTFYNTPNMSRRVVATYIRENVIGWQPMRDRSQAPQSPRPPSDLQ